MSEKLNFKHLTPEEMKAEVARIAATRTNLGGVACGACPLAAICVKKETAAAANCRDGDGRREPSEEEILRKYREELEDRSKNLVMAQLRRVESSVPSGASRTDGASVSTTSVRRRVIRNGEERRGKTIGEDIANIAGGMFGVRALQATRAKK